MTGQIERQIERFAPGFRDRILAKTVMSPADLERNNANYVGGDITGGFLDLRQLFTRPVVRIPRTPHRTNASTSALRPLHRVAESTVSAVSTLPVPRYDVPGNQSSGYNISVDASFLCSESCRVNADKH
jgi:hypothetical protein